MFEIRCIICRPDLYKVFRPKKANEVSNSTYQTVHKLQYLKVSGIKLTSNIDKFLDMSSICCIIQGNN